MHVTIDDVRASIHRLGLAHRPLCVHSSLRSFGWVTGGASAVVDGLLAEECTLMVPTFSESFNAVPPPSGRHVLRNGGGDNSSPDTVDGGVWRYTTSSRELDSNMGAIAAEVLRRPSHVRGDHPRDSFAAVGPLATALISGQRPLDVYAPFRELLANNGVVILMGVGLDRMTLLHLAEQMAGRRLFRRWGRDSHGQTIECEEGGCSSGFGNLSAALASLEQQELVGRSLWRIFPASQTLDVAAQAIRANPAVTHCDNPRCVACDDAIAGGPVVPDDPCIERR